MAKVTQLVGLVLVAVGVIGYLVTDRSSWTALLPALIGLVFLVLGVLGARGESGRHYMHAAMVVALLGAAASLTRAGGLFDGDAAAIASAITGVACLVLLSLGIRFFVEARRGR